VKKLRELRKDIARIKTIARERELGVHGAEHKLESSKPARKKAAKPVRKKAAKTVAKRKTAKKAAGKKTSGRTTKRAAARTGKVKKG